MSNAFWRILQPYLRRVSLDLIGLPPSPAYVQAYVEDPSPMALAYAQAVNRLLASKHFGERWARPWLDLARYAAPTAIRPIRCRHSGHSPDAIYLKQRRAIGAS